MTDKFWEWMVATGKGNVYKDGDDVHQWIYDDMGSNVGWTKQAIIGYMIEYLIRLVEPYDDFIIRIEIVKFLEDTDVLYDLLVKRIKDLEN